MECPDTGENYKEFAGLVEKHYKETKHTPIRIATFKREKL
jgi:hypothetical protein